MIDRSLKNVIPEKAFRTLEDMDRQMTQMAKQLATLQGSIVQSNVQLSKQGSDIAGLVGARSQAIVGQDVADPSLPGSVAGGTVSSVTIVAGTNLTGGGTITTTGSVTLNLSANPSVTTVDASTSYKVGSTKVVGAQGAAVPDAAGGATIDAEARTAINDLLARVRAHGLIAT